MTETDMNKKKKKLIKNGMLYPQLVEQRTQCPCVTRHPSHITVVKW